MLEENKSYLESKELKIKDKNQNSNARKLHIVKGVAYLTKEFGITIIIVTIMIISFSL